MRTFLALAGLSAGLLSSAVLAADLPRRAPPPVFTPVPVFTWTGAYFGINAGYAFSEDQTVRTTGNDLVPTNTILNVALARRPSRLRSEQDGFTGGAQLGYNYQLTPGSGFVIGFEADAAYTDLSRTRQYLSPPQAANGFVSDPSTFRQNLDFLATVRARIGYAFDRVLVYGTGGLAYGNVEYDAQFFANNAARTLAYRGQFNDIVTGYAYGGGIEYAIPTDSFLNVFRSSAVTAKVEYIRYDLGTRNVNVGFTGLTAARGSYTSRFETEGSIVRAGLNYKFGFGGGGS